MDSKEEYSSSSDDSADQSVNFSYFSDSSSVKKINEIPQSESLTPGSSSSFQIEKLINKSKGKKTKKKTKVKSKQNQSDKKTTTKAQPEKSNRKDLLKNSISKDFVINVDLGEKNSGEKTSDHSNRFTLSPKEAKYLTVSQFPKKYSLRDVEKSRQISFDEGIQSNIKIVYAEVYILVQNFINEMLQNEEVPDFFKYDIYEVTKLEAAKNYYHEYRDVIPKSLSLSTILLMIKNGTIRNFHQFRRKIDEMILNSRFFHTLKGNLYMIERGNFLKRKFHESFCRQLHPEGNMYEQDFIKTTNQKRPKIEQENQVRYMELTDEHNKYLFSVMNKFLRIACLKSPEKVEFFIGTIENIIKRYPNSKISIIKHEQTNQSKEEEKDSGPKELNSKSKPSSQSLLSPPYSTKSRVLSQQGITCLLILPQKIEVDLFQQLKALIRREVQQRRPSNLFDEEMRDQTDKMMYPHEDSDDFDLDDDSDNDS